jgi:hypothetical protein
MFIKPAMLNELTLSTKTKQRIFRDMEENYFEVLRINPKGTIRKRMGEWYTPHEGNHKKWSNYVNTTTKEIYVPIYDGVLKGYFKQIIAQSERTNSLSFSSNTPMRITKILPMECIPADDYRDGAKCTVKYYRGMNKFIDRQREKATPRTNNWETVTCQNLSIKRTKEDIRNRGRMAKSIFYIITDGGTYEYNGTYGVVITQEETM